MDKYTFTYLANTESSGPMWRIRPEQEWMPHTDWRPKQVEGIFIEYQVL